MDTYQRAAAYAERIERELRGLGAWQAEPPPDSAFESEQAFFADTLTFFQWLQFILLPRVREVIGERGGFPDQSQVGAYAVRELDGYIEASELIQTLCEFDEFIEASHHSRKRRRGLHVVGPVAAAEPEPEPEPPPAPVVREPALAVAERYWRTRDPLLLHAQPHSRAGMDTQLADGVFASATGLVEILEETEDIEGRLVRTVVQAERGAWVVLTVLCQDRGDWRVDLPLSVLRTTMMFLREHHIHPPHTDTDDARGRAMQFWQHVANHDERRARDLVEPEGAEIPLFGEGQIDEFFWYLGHIEEGDAATVRVLMNTHAECRVWLTRMVRRGEWRVDLPGTLEARNA